MYLPFFNQRMGEKIRPSPPEKGRDPEPRNPRFRIFLWSDV